MVGETNSFIRRIVSVTLMVLLMVPLSLSIPAPPAQASISQGIGDVQPHQVLPNTSTPFQFQITNNDSTNPIQYIRFDLPSGYFLSISQASASGWSEAIDADGVTFTGGAINPADTNYFQVTAEAFNGTSPPVSWFTHISDDPGGSGSILCDGDLSTEITNGPPPTLSNIALSNLSTNRVTINWTTDLPSDSVVNYGLTDSYGEVVSSGAATTSHSLTITGLTTNTGYHYQVQSTNSAGTTISSDNTFLTALQQAPVIVAAPTGSNVPGVTIKAAPTEKVPPTASLTTDLARPFKQSPKITGRAADNEAVARVEYSLNGGKDWLPVDHIQLAGGKKPTAANITFDFTPLAAEDGNYQVVAKATDTSGNQALTTVATLVIDRLPPQLGPLVISYGPEVLIPDSSGIMSLLEGSDYKLTTSGVGGPISVVVEARLTGQKADTAKTFTLSQSADSGLWNGLLSFAGGGNYDLTVRSVDGAGNKTDRVIMSAAVTPAGRITDNKTKKPLADAKLTLYYLEPSAQTWEIWDGAPYSQINPQRTKSDGTYSLAVPQGKYYLRIEAPVHHAFISDIFEITHPTGLSASVALDAIKHLRVGSWKLHLPDITLRSQPLPLTEIKNRPQTVTSQIDTMVPDFNLPTLNGASRRNLDLEGRPTVISTVATWSPSSQSQLSALAAAQTNRDINVVPVFSQEHYQLVSIYLATAGYKLDGLVDSDGVLVPALRVGSLPQHVFVDRTGRIKKVMVGVLSKDELLSQLGGL